MTTVYVTDLQIQAAKAVIELAGGPDNVEPIFVKIAAAKPRKSKPPASGDSSS